MFSFFKRCEYQHIRNKLIIVYALNINDIQLTKFLLRTNMFREANPVMDFFLSTSSLTFFSKVVLPAVLILYIILRLKKADSKQLKKANIFVNIIFIIYALINMMHLLWIILYFIVV